ncbi:MAG: asparagine synthase (glutamine-hydrolyzing) [Ignavibacteriaceae bacterium]|nr:asparagine synthase (glutamine-hydrolyzing) [Ignavibacteriaceae bacterium]
MCGITGILNLSEPIPISVDILALMAGHLNHRGPNESGVYIDDWTGIAQTRLSIIDLAGGTQPIHNEDKTLWIVFNGEIYNYIELKNTLLALGHRFYTNTDTEIILHLYEDKQENCLHLLNGQFAFAIWDSVKQKLFIARDRVGKKPLYYTICDNQFIFGSEIKSIFAYNKVNREIDKKGIDQVFTYWTTLPGKTFFKNINELPAGSYISISGDHVTVKQYWDFDFALPDEQVNYNANEITAHSKELLMDSIGIRLRADVPVGCYLSGGLDSSGIATLVKNNFNNKLNTFGIRFSDEEFDEGQYQKEMVSKLNVEHKEITAENKDIGELLPEVIWHTEIPLLRLSPVPLYMLSKLVNQSGFRVVLTGEGADEVFGGYNIFRETLIRSFWSKYPDSKIRPRLLEQLYPYIFKDKRNKSTLSSFFKVGIDQPDNPFFSHLIRWNNTARLKKFFSDDVTDSLQHNDTFMDLNKLIPERFSKWDALSKAQYLEMKIFMSDYLLSSQGDRVAMAHSLEIRMPYLDYRLIEFMGKVPSYLKIMGLTEKFILKKLYKDILPNSIVNRPKHPYRAPIKNSLLNKNLQYVEHFLSESKLKNNNLFNSSMVKLLLEKLTKADKSSEFDNMALVSILTTQILNDIFIDNYDTHKSAPSIFNVVFDKRSTLKNDHHSINKIILNN